MTVDTQKNRELILNSRIDSTKVLGKALKLINHHPRFGSMLALRLYKDLRGDKPPHDEESMGNAEDSLKMLGEHGRKPFLRVVQKIFGRLP